MTLANYYNQIPAYHPAMHLQGYTPQEIYNSFRKTVYENYLDRKEEQEMPMFQIKSVVNLK